MASLVTGVTLVDGSTVTAATLHSMIEDATISGLAASDMAASGQLLQVSASAPDPSEGNFWWDTDYVKGQVLRIYDTRFSAWLAVGPDRLELPFRNDSGDTLFRGAAVVLHSSNASAITIATGATLSLVGFCQETTASGAWAPVAICGIGFVAYGTAQSTASGGGRDAVTGEAFSTWRVPAGRVGSPNPLSWVENSDDASVVRGWIHGHYLEEVSGANQDELDRRGYRALITGPKLARYEPG